MWDFGDDDRIWNDGVCEEKYVSMLYDVNEIRRHSYMIINLLARLEHVCEIPLFEIGLNKVRGIEIRKS